MATGLMQRKVLMFGDDPSIRNLLRVFTSKLSAQGDETQNEAARAVINRKAFDEVLIDLRCSYSEDSGGHRPIGEVQPSLVGRVLVIVAEVRDIETLELLERYLAEGLSQSLHLLVGDHQPVPTRALQPRRHLPDFLDLCVRRLNNKPR